MRTAIGSCIVAAAAAVVVAAQTTPARPSFEVVSIKRPDPNRRLPAGITMPFVYSPGGKRLQALQISPFSLLQTAFSAPDRPIRTSQIVNAPGWTETQMYEIEVTTAADVRQTTGVFGAMVRSMLEDRFALKAHVESRPFPVYALVRAKADGSLGPQLHPSTVDCDAEAKKQQEALERDRNAVIAATLASTGRPACSARLIVRPTGMLTAGAVSTTSLAGYLNNAGVGLDRIVLDLTGLQGRYDIDLHWTPPTPAQADGGAASLSDGPSIFTAVTEQLGLKLDHIEPPTPN